MVVAWDVIPGLISGVEVSAPFQNGEGNKWGRRMSVTFKESRRMCRAM